MKHHVKYVIVTQYGDKYETDSKGRVLRYSNGLDKTNASEADLETWKIRGIQEIRAFNQLGPVIPLKDVIDTIDEEDFLFKNGNPRYTIADIDHGTFRTVGNWNVHGVKRVELAKVDEERCPSCDEIPDIFSKCKCTNPN